MGSCEKKSVENQKKILKKEKKANDFKNLNKNKKEKNLKKQKTLKKEKIDTNRNIFRQFGNFFNSIFNFNRLKGVMYFNVHLYMMFIIGFATLFSTSIATLIALLVIVSMDALSIVVLHECPLTTMEKKYLGISSCEIRNEFLYNAGIMYTCDHDYEKQIELLINVWTMIAAKCLLIIFLQMFYIKLFDVSNIYINF